MMQTTTRLFSSVVFLASLASAQEYFPLAVGTREITVRNAAGAERRSMTTVTVEPLRLDIDFSKP